MPDHEVCDVTGAYFLPDGFGSGQQAADGSSHGSVVGLGRMLGDRSGPLQNIEPVPELLQLREDAVIFLTSFGCLNLRVHRLLDVLPGELTTAHRDPGRPPAHQAQHAAYPAHRYQSSGSRAVPAQKRCSTTRGPRP
jgi:hypothetical protein